MYADKTIVGLGMILVLFMLLGAWLQGPLDFSLCTDLRHELVGHGKTISVDPVCHRWAPT